MKTQQATCLLFTLDFTRLNRDNWISSVADGFFVCVCVFLPLCVFLFHLLPSYYLICLISNVFGCSLNTYFGSSTLPSGPTMLMRSEFNFHAPSLSHTHPQRHEHVQGNPAGNCQDCDASSSHIAIHHAAASHRRGRRHPSFLMMSMHRVLHLNAVHSSRMRHVTTWNENGSLPCSVSFSLPPSVSHYLVLSVQHLPQSPKNFPCPSCDLVFLPLFHPWVLLFISFS